MNAIQVQALGGPEVLQMVELPEPQPHPGEVRIRVIAAGVNPADWKLREHGGIPLPFIPGADVAGVIDRVGVDAAGYQPGDAVFARIAQGGYAEYAVTAASHVAPKPATLDFIGAAAVPTAALAAWQALFDTADLVGGQQLFINGAAGGVGSFAVQFARWKGAEVYGTASAEHADFVLGLGAQGVVDYHTKRIEDAAQDMDVVLDTVGGESMTHLWPLLKPGGILVTLVSPIPEDLPTTHGVRAVRIITRPDGSELAAIGKLIDEGHVHPAVTTVLPLTEARKAQEMSEGHHVSGKIVLRVAPEPEAGQKAA
jgi:NADPH:quinone reductase-like Zn-dependent oxidoreductase